MTHIAKKVFLILFALFCCIACPQNSAAQHISYWCADGNTGDNGTKCNENAMHEDCGSKDCDTLLEFVVKPWQKCESGTTKPSERGYYAYYITGFCNKDCLDYVKEPEYYDDPAKPGIQKDGENATGVTLPVVLAWKDVRGFGDNSSQIARCSGKDSDCSHSDDNVAGDGYGPISYRIQIWDDSDTGYATLDMRATGNKQRQIEDGPIAGKKAFYDVLTKSGKKFGFNSRTDAGACFFSSSSTYHWRVTACCKADGTGCKDYKPGWWTFTTSTAPEMVSPLDPDWNGTAPNGAGAAEKSFKDILPGRDPLKWCAARLPPAYQEKNKPVRYAKSYQMEVTSNEKNDFTEKVLNLYKTVSNWFLSAAGLTPAAPNQSTHALAVINGNLIYNIYPDPVTGEVKTEYPDQGRNDLAFFSRNRTYSWKLKSCPDDFTVKCFDEYGQGWGIITPPEKIPAPSPESPKNDPSGKEPVGFPINISWTIPAGANSFVYQTEITNFLGERKTSWSKIPNEEFDDPTKELLSLKNVAIGLNADYRWRVKSCATFDSGKKNPADCDEWSPWFSFRTTGRPPVKDSMTPNFSPDTKITFPQNFTWEKVPGARSYKIKLYGAAGEKIKTVKFGPQDPDRPGTQFDYRDIQPPADKISSKNYTWQVQTCADENGEKCGAWESQYFSVKRPSFPEIKSGKNSFGSLKDLELKWTGQTKYYWLTINYDKPQPLVQSDCDLANPIVSKTIEGNSCSADNGCLPSEVKDSCMGTYRWKIQPCVNPDCSDRGEDNAKSGTFAIVAGESDDNTFSVCGQTFDNPKTEWYETERCEIRHLFLLFKIVIDFILFKLSLYLLPILVLITGGLFYLPTGNPDTVQNIKRMWKYIGIGYALMIFAWLLTSWLMAIVGYDKLWWKIL